MAMRQVITARVNAPGTGAGTNYHTLSLGPQMGDEVRSQRNWRVTGVFRKLRIQLVTLPSAASTITLTLRINEADTAMTVSLNDTELTKTYTASDISVTAGNRICWKTTNSGTGGGKFTISVEFEPTSGQESCYGGGGVNGSGTTPLYFSIMSDGIDATAANNMAHVITTDGTITSHGVCLYAIPAGATDVTFTMYKSTDNGATWVIQDGSSGSPDTRVVLGAARTNAATFSMSVSAGNLIISRYDRTGGSPINVYGQTSFSFNPSTPGQFMVVGRSEGTTSNSGTSYEAATNSLPWNAATITSWSSLSGISDMTLRNFRVWLSTAPGSAKTYVFDNLLNESTTPPASTPTITITGTGTPIGVDSVNTLVCVDTNLITVRSVATSTPAAARSAWGFVSGGAPGKGGGKSKPPKGNPGFNAIESGGAAVYNIGNPGLSVT